MSHEPSVAFSFKILELINHLYFLTPFKEKCMRCFSIKITEKNNGLQYQSISAIFFYKRRSKKDT